MRLREYLGFFSAPISACDFASLKKSDALICSPKLGWFSCSDRTYCSRLGAPALNECVQVRPVVEDPAANLYRARPLTLHGPMSERLLAAVPQISCRVLAGHAAIGGNAYPDPLDSRHVAIHLGHPPYLVPQAHG